ncbi:MAG: FtsX-like permease family protein [Bowdeniella nasicola]|nr:FtsX-like permease family protein [Bowdeniella nasicola]
MFRERAANPPAEFVRLVAESSFATGEAVGEFAHFYVNLTVIAIALLVVPILGLGGAAARLGASGRARRLASLRLIGMTGGEVVLMSIIETIVLAAIGAVLGAGLYLVSLPAWRAVSFHHTAISPGEMVVPWPLGLAIVAAIVVLAVLLTVLELRRVRISPLGVAHRHTAPALRSWRVFLLLAAAAGFYLLSSGVRISSADLTVFLILGAGIAVVVGAINLGARG